MGTSKPAANKETCSLVLEGFCCSLAAQRILHERLYKGGAIDFSRSPHTHPPLPPISYPKKTWDRVFAQVPRSWDWMKRVKHSSLFLILYGESLDIYDWYLETKWVRETLNLARLYKFAVIFSLIKAISGEDPSGSNHQKNSICFLCMKTVGLWTCFFHAIVCYLR